MNRRLGVAPVSWASAARASPGTWRYPPTVAPPACRSRALSTSRSDATSTPSPAGSPKSFCTEKKAASTTSSSRG